MADVDETFRALADPTRRRIIELVAQRGMSAGEIASHFDTTRPAVSQHLTVLRNADLVVANRIGRTRIYQTNPQTVDEVVRHLQSFWSGRLQDLKRAAESEERHKRGKR
ncbi:MAG TPA: metalloregulator ArsR/SmtB family transcription factor [Acidimicrobiia bacterium]|nr:metalloregulator ArsR/SmtB family transcription factor [Acidimicrobiia bacterium]